MVFIPFVNTAASLRNTCLYASRITPVADQTEHRCVFGFRPPQIDDKTVNKHDDRRSLQYTLTYIVTYLTV